MTLSVGHSTKPASLARKRRSHVRRATLTTAIGIASVSFALVKSAVRNRLILWRPRRDLNPCYRRERAAAEWNSNKLRGTGRSVRPCKVPVGTKQVVPSVYRKLRANQAAEFTVGDRAWTCRAARCQRLLFYKEEMVASLCSAVMPILHCSTLSIFGLRL